MYAICMAESYGNHDATGYNNNGTVDRGIFQVNSCHQDLIGDQDIYDEDVNIQVSYKIWLGGGYNAWSTYNNGNYLKYME